MSAWIDFVKFVIFMSIGINKRFFNNENIPRWDINENIPPEQAGFRPERSCCDQVLALPAHIDNGFEQKKKTAISTLL